MNFEYEIDLSDNWEVDFPFYPPAKKLLMVRRNSLSVNVLLSWPDAPGMQANSVNG